jgi:predicted deacetylase
MQPDRFSTLTTSGIFFVVLHDVAPPFVGELSAILDELRPYVGNQVSAGVVPCWHGEPICGPERRAFVRFCEERFGEILLHGFEHRRRRGNGLLSALTGSANELGGLSFTQALAKIVDGHDRLTRLFGQAPAGFVPPAWDRGPTTLRMLRACGLDYAIGMTAIERHGAPRIPLATWSWDSGRYASLGHIGHALGHVMHAARPHAVPCVAFHPADVGRRFVAQGARLVASLVAGGRKPVLFRQVACSSVPLAA